MPEKKERPDAYHKRVGKCPPDFEFDGEHCVPRKDATPEKPAAKAPSSPQGATKIPEEHKALHKLVASAKESVRALFPASEHKAAADKKAAEAATAAANPAPDDQNPDDQDQEEPEEQIPGFDSVEEYAQAEADEYFENDFTKTMFPDAFDDEDDFIEAVKEAPTERKLHWADVENYSGGVGEVKHGQINKVRGDVWRMNKERWMEEEPDKERAKRTFEKYFDKLVDACKAGATPPSIVGVHYEGKKKTEYLVAGNTRASIYAALGKPAPVKHIMLKGRMRHVNAKGWFDDDMPKGKDKTKDTTAAPASEPEAEPTTEPATKPEAESVEESFEGELGVSTAHHGPAWRRRKMKKLQQADPKKPKPQKKLQRKPKPQPKPQPKRESSPAKQKLKQEFRRLIGLRDHR